jgi:hypothetical protein
MYIYIHNYSLGEPLKDAMWLVPDELYTYLWNICMCMYIYLYVYLYVYILVNSYMYFHILLHMFRWAIKGRHVARSSRTICISLKYMYVYVYTSICIYIYVYILVNSYLYFHIFVYMFRWAIKGRHVARSKRIIYISFKYICLYIYICMFIHIDIHI